MTLFTTFEDDDALHLAGTDLDTEDLDYPLFKDDTSEDPPIMSTQS